MDVPTTTWRCKGSRSSPRSPVAMKTRLHIIAGHWSFIQRMRQAATGSEPRWATLDGWPRRNASLPRQQAIAAATQCHVIWREAGVFGWISDFVVIG
jgi:hypothetical protein